MRINPFYSSHPWLTSGIDSTSTTFQPFFLNFYKVHALATQFFLRMWNESGASRGDFPRLVALTRSQCVSCSFNEVRANTDWGVPAG